MTAINTSHAKQASPDLNNLHERKRRNSFQKLDPQGLISCLRGRSTPDSPSKSLFGLLLPSTDQPCI